MSCWGDVLISCVFTYCMNNTHWTSPVHSFLSHSKAVLLPRRNHFGCIHSFGAHALWTDTHRKGAQEPTFSRNKCFQPLTSRVGNDRQPNRQKRARHLGLGEVSSITSIPAGLSRSFYFCYTAVSMGGCGRVRNIIPDLSVVTISKDARFLSPVVRRGLGGERR